MLTNIFVCKSNYRSQKPWRWFNDIWPFWGVWDGGGLLKERLYQLHKGEGEFTVNHGRDQELFHLLRVRRAKQVKTGTLQYQITAKMCSSDYC